MSQEKAMLMMLKGVMSGLEDDDQAKAKSMIAQINAIVEEAGDLAPLVIGIPSLEYAIKAESEG